MQPPPSPYGVPAPWPAAQRPTNLFLPVIAVVAVVIVIVLLAAGLVIGPAFGDSGSLAFFVFAPFCAIFLVLVAVVIFFAMNATRRAQLPPPPPIQQPMVPAGMQGPVALDCPNCGAPPGGVDRFGVATCTHCGTRFLVR